MIDAQKMSLALYVVHRVLVEARLMAYENADHSKIARFLDIAELLPEHLAAPKDKMADFRKLLVDLANERPHLIHLLRRFDEGRIPQTYDPTPVGANE
jgi:hypothetical protein